MPKMFCVCKNVMKLIKNMCKLSDVQSYNNLFSIASVVVIRLDLPPKSEPILNLSQFTQDILHSNSGYPKACLGNLCQYLMTVVKDIFLALKNEIFNLKHLKKCVFLKLRTEVAFRMVKMRSKNCCCLPSASKKIWCE